MTGLLATGCAIVGVWGGLLGMAALCRRHAVGQKASIALVLACYGCFAAAAIAVLGSNWQGAAGAFGMLLPCAAALALVSRP